jgi:hypothetical protein
VTASGKPSLEIQRMQKVEELESILKRYLGDSQVKRPERIFEPIEGAEEHYSGMKPAVKGGSKYSL